MCKIIMVYTKKSLILNPSSHTLFRDCEHVLWKFFLQQCILSLSCKKLEFWIMDVFNAPSKKGQDLLKLYFEFDN